MVRSAQWSCIAFGDPVCGAASWVAQASETTGDIADCEGGAHLATAILHAGEHRGDADLAAQAILTPLDDPQPPSTLLLGDDALHYAEDQLADLAQQYDRRRLLTFSIARARG